MVRFHGALRYLMVHFHGAFLRNLVHLHGALFEGLVVELHIDTRIDGALESAPGSCVRKQPGGHPVTKLLCSQAPPPHITRPGVAPGVQSLGPARGKLNCFCPWGAVFGASAGQIEPFLPLGCSLWGLRGAN